MNMKILWSIDLIMITAVSQVAWADALSSTALLATTAPTLVNPCEREFERQELIADCSIISDPRLDAGSTDAPTWAHLTLTRAVNARSVCIFGGFHGSDGLKMGFDRMELASGKLKDRDGKRADFYEDPKQIRLIFSGFEPGQDPSEPMQYDAIAFDKVERKLRVAIYPPQGRGLWMKFELSCD